MRSGPVDAALPCDRRSWQCPALAIGLLCGALVATLAAAPRPWLVWNVSASAPVGLYRITSPTALTPGDMVIARVPAAWRSLAARRRYIPSTVPLVKQVAAVSGDLVCASGRTIFINGRDVARRQQSDAHGRPLPWWRGCVRLRPGAVFLLMSAPSSFDGRYFGVSDGGDILGRARLLWTR